MKKHLLIVAVLIATTLNVKAQTDSTNSRSQIQDEYSYLRVNTLDFVDEVMLRDASVVQGLYGSLYLNTFFKNNEYFGDFIKGYTLTGVMFQPQLSYHINQHLQVGAMLNAISYHGYNDEKFSEFRPYFRIVFRPNESFTLISGFLEGNCKHDMIEPILNPERCYLTTNLSRYFTKNIENGFQLLVNKPRYSMDMWLNWENFILWGDNDKERLSVGHLSKFHIVDCNSFKLDIVGEFLVSHRGGQIDSCEIQVQSLENGALGLDIHVLGNQESVFRQFSLRTMAVQYHAIDETDDLPWENGSGVYTKASVRMWDFGFVAGYWFGNKFLNFRGDPLYTCWALENVNNKSKRSVIFNELYYSKNYYDNRFILRAGINTWYDIKAGNLEYAYMISLATNLYCGMR